MLIKIRRSWELPESAVTPEHLFFNRRGLLKGAGAIGAALAPVSYTHLDVYKRQAVQRVARDSNIASSASVCWSSWTKTKKTTARPNARGSTSAR